MSKFIIINYCNECPHHKTESSYGFYDKYKLICNHPDLDEPLEDMIKCKREYEPFWDCPLSDASEIVSDI